MDNCPFCGAELMLGFSFWYDCGFRDDPNSRVNPLRRPDKCYEAQLAHQAELLRRAEEVVRMVVNTVIDMESIHPDGLPAKYLSAYEGMLLVGPEATSLLPELEKALGVKP